MSSLDSTWNIGLHSVLLPLLNFDGFFNFDGLTLLTALVLYSQSDYLSHSDKDSDWLIVACFMRV